MGKLISFQVVFYALLRRRLVVMLWVNHRCHRLHQSRELLITDPLVSIGVQSAYDRNHLGFRCIVAGSTTEMLQRVKAEKAMPMHIESIEGDLIGPVVASEQIALQDLHLLVKLNFLLYQEG